MNKKLKICGLLILLSIFCIGCVEKTTLDKKQVEKSLNKVAVWQIENFGYAETGSSGYLHDYGIDAWTNAVLYLGMSQWAKNADKDNSAYYDWLYDIGKKTNWTIPENFIDYPNYRIYHADELCIGQFYLSMHDTFQDENMLISTKKRTDWIIENPPKSGMKAKNKQKWSWCDALFMAAPVYAHLAQIEQNDKYLTFMHNEFMDTYNHLYDKENGLFFRDDNYFEKRELNGEKVFWGRGNGWVVAALAQILRYLPKNYEHRNFYEDLFVKLSDRLLELRDDAGFWHASLLDPESYPSPETSATALITYAMAYGVNNGLLNKKEYIPHVEKSWYALLSIIDNDGKLGFVQPIGADPRKVTKDMTAVYGVGAFLLAGNEIYQIAK